LTTFVDRKTFSITHDGVMAKRTVAMPASVVKSAPPISVTLGADVEPQAAAKLLRMLANQLEAAT
jgi:hypothetical protein